MNQNTHEARRGKEIRKAASYLVLYKIRKTYAPGTQEGQVAAARAKQREGEEDKNTTS